MNGGKRYVGKNIPTYYATEIVAEITGNNLYRGIWGKYIIRLLARCALRLVYGEISENTVCSRHLYFSWITYLLTTRYLIECRDEQYHRITNVRWKFEVPALPIQIPIPIAHVHLPSAVRRSFREAIAVGTSSVVGLLTFRDLLLNFKSGNMESDFKGLLPVLLAISSGAILLLVIYILFSSRRKTEAQQKPKHKNLYSKGNFYFKNTFSVYLG